MISDKIKTAVNCIPVRNGTEYLMPGDIIKPITIQSEYVLLKNETAKILKVVRIDETALNGDLCESYRIYAEIVTSDVKPMIGKRIALYNPHEYTNIGGKRKFRDLTVS